ncbi:MAG: TIGR02147 family protein [Myxococcota bacterium]
MRTGAVPEVFAYVSYRRYLADWYAARKQADSRFSHRLFARRSGSPSPSLLAEVIAGKRNLSAERLEGFVQALSLTGSAAGFFRDLVALDQGATEAERTDAWARIAAHRRFRSARPIDGDAFAYLSTWSIAAIRELALRPDFRPEPEWIARTLTPRIPVAEARRGLEVLRALGMLAEGEDGRTVPTEASVATPHQVQGLAVHAYHRQMLELAREAIGAVSSRERHLVGVTVAVPESLVPALKAELDQLQERLLHLCDEHADRAERVYQLELCLFPLSRGLGVA